MPKYRVMLGRFPYLGDEACECVDWMVQFAVRVNADPRFELVMKRIADTPITMTRNQMILAAQQAQADFLLMVDSDMAPDLYLGVDRQAKPFWESSIEFMLDHPGPSVVGAPYCGPPPHENVYVFEWLNKQSDNPNVDVKLDQITREKAAILGGIQEVAALPTGLIIFDMRAFKKLPPPWFSYEYQGDGDRCPGCNTPKAGPQAFKSSTEDVVLTRDLSLAGVPQYCNWDAWAGHVKRKVVGRPVLYTCDGVAKKLHEAVKAGRAQGERLRVVQSDRFADDIAAAVCFLASDEASYVNGTALVVDGGLASSHPTSRRFDIRML